MLISTKMGLRLMDEEELLHHEQGWTAQSQLFGLERI